MTKTGGYYMRDMKREREWLILGHSRCTFQPVCVTGEKWKEMWKGFKIARFSFKQFPITN